jgi:hypothetical protein
VILRLSSKTGAATLVGKARPVLTVVPGTDGTDDPHGGASLIDEIVREGARRMLAEALQAEVDDYILPDTAPPLFTDIADQFGVVATRLLSISARRWPC